jgi:hypothetical protein
MSNQVSIKAPEPLALAVPLSRFTSRVGGGSSGREAADILLRTVYQMKDIIMKASGTFPAGFVVLVVFILLATSVSAKAELRIEKAFCGAKGSWCDVTAFLQSKVRGDTLSIKISQPYREIGGDPASGQVKNLIIDYRFNGGSFRLLLKEQYPVAFTVELPSADAGAPGNDPLATALIKDAKSHQRGGHSWLSYLSYGITLISIIWAVVASIQLRKLKKQLNKNT